MKSILCTFSGKYGDILWSLPTAREIAKANQTSVDFAVMPTYASLMPLINNQSYINQAFVIPNWQCIGSPWGDQPWLPPKPVNVIYDYMYHLTYRRHPSSSEPLIDFIASQQNLRLSLPVCPFIECDTLGLRYPFVAYAFNDMYPNEKSKFLDDLKRLVGQTSPVITFMDVTKHPWADAASYIREAVCFIGCMSASWVVANGVAQSNIFLFEPHPNRNLIGWMGNIFGNPYWKAVSAPVEASPEAAAQMAFEYIKQWVTDKEDNYAAD